GAATKVTSATLKVKARSDAAKRSFSQNRTWSGFGVHSHFDQTLVKFRNQVAVTFKIIKGWGATWVNMSSGGITGKAGGCPWDGYRWGKSSSPRSMQPDKYWDGRAWADMPSGFTVSADKYGTLSFYKDGSTFKNPQGGTYPE